MKTLLGHAGCTLSGQHLMKHRSTGVVFKNLLQPFPKGFHLASENTPAHATSDGSCVRN